MAVLVEANSVIIRMDAIRSKFPKGFSGFCEHLPNATLCADKELARVGFMTLDDVAGFIHLLERSGLTYRRDGKAQDLNVVDQLHGMATPCDWLEPGRIALRGDAAKKVAACRMRGGQSQGLAVPEEWQFEGSLSQSHDFVADGQPVENYQLVRREEGLDVLIDRNTQKEVYVGRVTAEPKTPDKA